MPSINNTHNMGGVRNTTSTESTEKTPAGKPYSKPVKLFASQLKNNAREAVKGFNAEILRSRFEKFCATTGPQAKQCASDLCKQAEIHLQKGCKETHKQWKKAKPHLEKAMHSIQKNYGTLKKKIEGKIEQKLDEWAQKRGYKREPENDAPPAKWEGLTDPYQDARNAVPEFHRGGAAKVNTSGSRHTAESERPVWNSSRIPNRGGAAKVDTSGSQHTAESERPVWNFSKIPKGDFALLKEARGLFEIANRPIGYDDDYNQMMDEKNQAKEELDAIFTRLEKLEQTAKRFN